MTGETLQNVPVFVILDVYGMYLFALSFGDFDFYSEAIPPGASYINVLEPFAWPESAGQASGIHWYAAMTYPEITTVQGHIGSFTFGWY